MTNKGERMVTTGTKFGFGAVIFGFSYINHIFSPLIWALLILIILDILLNVHKEGQQLQKIGSAFMTLGGADLFQNTHLFSISVIHGLVGVMVLAYLQVVVPRLINVVKKIKGISAASKNELLLALQAENEALKQQAQKQEQENKVVIAKGE